jgi:CRISPR-associated protein Cas1
VETPKIQDGILILHGYNAGLHVWNRHLVCRYGTADEAGELALAKADASGALRHVLIMGGDGSLTTQALRWLSSLQISLTMIENDGQVLLALGRQNYPYATMARRQALAVYQETGLNVARWLIAQKLQGQAENLDGMRLPSESVRKELRALVSAKSIDQVMLHEAQAAAYYWKRLEAVRLSFVRKNSSRIPKRWLTLGSRISPLSKRAMHAATPGQAMLNYLYGVAESLCAIHLAAVGLNPEVGIMHTDVDSRRSMALDLIETIRPEIDRLAITFFRQQVFSKLDFWETDRGSVRLGQAVRRVLISNVFTLESQALAHATSLRDLLSNYRTRLTRRRGLPTRNLVFIHRCKYCGTPLPTSKRANAARVLCPDCRELHNSESINKGNAPGFRWTKAALEKHSRTTRARHLEIQRWEAQFSAEELQGAIQRERQRFVAEIMPRLQGVTVTRIANATGISLRYASLIKKGLNIPHPWLYPRFEACCNAMSANSPMDKRNQPR